MTQALTPHIGNVVVFDVSAGDNWSQQAQHSDGGHHPRPTSDNTEKEDEARKNPHHHHQQHRHNSQQQQHQSSVENSNININNNNKTNNTISGDILSITTHPSNSFISATTTNSTNNTTNARNSRTTTRDIFTSSSSSSTSPFFANYALSSSTSTPSSSAIEPSSAGTNFLISTSINYTTTTAAQSQTTTAASGHHPQANNNNLQGNNPQGDPLTPHTGHRLLLLLQQQNQTTITTTANNSPLASSSSSTSLLLPSSSSSSSSSSLPRKTKEISNNNNNNNNNNLLKSPPGVALSSLLLSPLSSSALPGKKSDIAAAAATTATYNNNNNNNNNNNILLKSSPCFGLSSPSSSSSPSGGLVPSSATSSSFLCSFTSSSLLRANKSPSTCQNTGTATTAALGNNLPSSPRTDTRKFRGLAGSRGPSSSSGGEATTGTTITTTTRPPSSGEENYPRISATPEDSKERLASIEENLESSISAKARSKISNILQDVNQMSDVEKLLLYLKLPTGATSDDQLTLSPTSSLHVSSRVEQSQACTWIKSHLEEDNDICLPKQEVYEDYKNYCESLNLRRLSTADFGKIMKCVFPNIKPRRLGQRGQSKYVYSGIRKKLSVQPPSLPELEISPRKLRENDCHGRDELFTASCQLVCEWAEKLLERAFSGLQELSEFLVSNSYVNSKTMAAFTVSAAMQEAGILNPSAAMSSLFSNASGGDKHRETQLQLQRKLQEREMLKEQKRRLHQQRQENEHERKLSPHRTRNESHTPGLPSPKTKFLSPSSCLRFRSSSSLENLLMPMAVSDNKFHIKEEPPVGPATGRERVPSAGSKNPTTPQEAATSTTASVAGAQVKIYSARSRQCTPSESSETRAPSRGGAVKDPSDPEGLEPKDSKILELANFHSLKKPSVIAIRSWADEKGASAPPPISTPSSANLPAVLSSPTQISAESLCKTQLLAADASQPVSSGLTPSEKSPSKSNAFVLNNVLEKTSRVGTGIPLVSQTGSVKSAFVPFAQMHLQNIAETKTTQSTDYLPSSSSQKNPSDHAQEPSILAQMLETNSNYIQVPPVKPDWESEKLPSVSLSECVTQTSPSIAKRTRSSFAPIRPKAMQAKTILSLLQEQSGTASDSTTPYERRRGAATTSKEKGVKLEQSTESVSVARTTASTPLPVTTPATATIATSAFGSMAAATEVVTFPVNPMVSKPNELFIILSSPATGALNAAGNVFLSPAQSSTNIPHGATIDPQQVAPAGTAILQAIPSVSGNVTSQAEVVLSSIGNANNLGTIATGTIATGEALGWKTFQLDTTALPHITIPGQQVFTSINQPQEVSSTTSLGLPVPISGGLVSTTNTPDCAVDQPAQFMVSKNIQLDGTLLSGFNWNLADPVQGSQGGHAISVSNLLPAELTTPQISVKMETAESDHSTLMSMGKGLSEEPTVSIAQQQGETTNPTSSIGKSGVVKEKQALISTGDGKDSIRSVSQEGSSGPPQKPASLLRPLLNSDLHPGEYTRTKILNELLSTEDSLSEEGSASNDNEPQTEKTKLATVGKSNLSDLLLIPDKPQQQSGAQQEKTTLSFQVSALTTPSNNTPSPAVGKTEKCSHRLLRTSSTQSSRILASQIQSRTLSADSAPSTVPLSSIDPTSAAGLDFLNPIPTSSKDTLPPVSTDQFFNQQKVDNLPSISFNDNLNTCALTRNAVSYSNKVISSHITGELPEPILAENPDEGDTSPFAIDAPKTDLSIKDVCTVPKVNIKSQPETHPSIRKRKASDKSLGTDVKRKSQMTSVTSNSQIDSTVTNSPLVRSGQDWISSVAEPLQSPDISSVEKDALLDSTPQLLGLELSNASSIQFMPSSKMSCHSQTVPSASDNKLQSPSSNLPSSQQFDRHLSDLLSLAQPLSLEGISPSATQPAADTTSTLPLPVDMATELVVFKRSVTDSVAALLQSASPKPEQAAKQGAAALTAEGQFAQEATPSLLQKHLTNMVDASLPSPEDDDNNEHHPQGKSTGFLKHLTNIVDASLASPDENEDGTNEGNHLQVKSTSFLSEMLKSSELSSQKKEFLEEELPSEVADFITESMTSNQRESVFPSGSASSSTGTGNLQPFPDLKQDVEDLLSQATPTVIADIAAAAAGAVGATSALGANVFMSKDAVKHATTSVSTLGEADPSHALSSLHKSSSQSRPFRDPLESTFAIPDAQAVVVRKGVDPKQGRHPSTGPSHPPQQQASSIQTTPANEAAVFRLSGQAPEFVAPNVTIPQRWHTLSYEKTGSHTPVSDSGYSSASPIRNTPPTVPCSFGSSAENLVNSVINQLENRSSSCEPPCQSPSAEIVQSYPSGVHLQISNNSTGPSPTSLPPSPHTFTPIHGTTLTGIPYDPAPIRPTATVADKAQPSPLLRTGSSQQPSKTNKENNRELLNLLQAKSPPSYENAIRMLSQKPARAAAPSSSGQPTQGSPALVSSSSSTVSTVPVVDAKTQPEQSPAVPAARPRAKGRSRSTSNTVTKGRKKKAPKDSDSVETKGVSMPGQLIRCLSDNSALTLSSSSATESSLQEEASTIDTKPPTVADEGPPTKKKLVQISPAYPFSFKLSLLRDRSSVGNPGALSRDSPGVSVEHTLPGVGEAPKLSKTSKARQEEGLGSGMLSVACSSSSTSKSTADSSSGISSAQAAATPHSQPVPSQNAPAASAQPKQALRQQKKSAHISELPNINYMGNAPNVDLSRVFWEKLLTTTTTTTKASTSTQGAVAASTMSAKGGGGPGASGSGNKGNAEANPSMTSVVATPTISHGKKNSEDQTKEVEEFKTNLSNLLGTNCLTAADLQALLGTELLSQALLVRTVQPQVIVTTSVSTLLASTVSATTTTTTTTPPTTVPSTTPSTTNTPSSSESSISEDEQRPGQRSVNRSVSYSPASMQ